MVEVGNHPTSPTQNSSTSTFRQVRKVSHGGYLLQGIPNKESRGGAWVHESIIGLCGNQDTLWIYKG